MGSRDYRHRETKKPKKGAEKPVQSIVNNTAPTTVEVIKAKGKKEKQEEAE